jgi:hypothetical protein
MTHLQKFPELPHTTEQLSAGEKRLLKICQQIRYGTISELHVIDGKPTFDPSPRIWRSHRLSEKCLTFTKPCEDFVLKDKHQLLLQILRDLNHGIVAELLVRNGLPEIVNIEEYAG